MEEEVEPFHWYEDLIWCPSQCYYYFVDPTSGQRYCIYLRWRWSDPWTCELVGCDEDWDLNWERPVPELTLDKDFKDDEYRALESAAREAAAHLFPHIPELTV